MNITSKRLLKGVQIFNMSGIEVLSKTNHLNEIDVSTLASAVYILKLDTEEQTIYKKIVIN